MSIPDTTGPIAQLTNNGSKDPTLIRLGWHTFVLQGFDRRNAGAWALEHIRYRWTFYADFARTTFYIEDSRDAVLFKLTWSQAMDNQKDTQ